LGIKNINFGNSTQSELLIATNENLPVLYKILSGDLRVWLVKICKDVSSNEEESQDMGRGSVMVIG
jgi:hypothetical protein